MFFFIYHGKILNFPFYFSSTYDFITIWRDHVEYFDVSNNIFGNSCWIYLIMLLKYFVSNKNSSSGHSFCLITFIKGGSFLKEGKIRNATNWT